MPIDWAVFYKNRNAFPLEELDRYAGQWVAWSPDGSRIVASSAESEEAVWAQVDAAGLPSFDFVYGYVPRADEVYLGSVAVRILPSGPDGLAPSQTRTR